MACPSIAPAVARARRKSRPTTTMSSGPSQRADAQSVTRFRPNRPRISGLSESLTCRAFPVASPRTLAGNGRGPKRGLCTDAIPTR